MSDEEKKAIESVKDMFEDVTIKDIDEQSITIYGVAMLDVIKVLTIVEKQSKEIEEFKEDNNELRKYYATRKEVEELKEINRCLHDSAENYIHIDKIKAKIEEVDKDENVSISDFMEYAKEYAKQKLQSLLEEKE